jgi:hypothetical protein
MAKRVDVSYESLRQEGREEVLEWLRQHEVINYSTPENKYFVFNSESKWLLFLPWEKSQK